MRFTIEQHPEGVVAVDEPKRCQCKCKSTPKIDVAPIPGQMTVDEAIAAAEREAVNG